MKILMICGTYPPNYCGIGDYSKNLHQALESLGMEVVIMANIDWSIFNYFEIRKNILHTKADIIHIQYPSVGFGTSLTPQLIALNFKVIVTLHEVSYSHFVRKISLLPFVNAEKLILTNEFEELAIFKLFPWVSSKKSVVIPIGSNILNSNPIKVNRNKKNIVSFGQIRPKKGLEQVIELALEIKKKGLDYKVIIMGQLIDKFEPYYKSLRAVTKDLPISWLINEEMDVVNQVLSDNLIAYLPFPDGVSERRGSLLAALTNRMIVITTMGKQTTEAIKKVVVIKGSVEEIINFIQESDFLITKGRMESIAKSYMDEISWSSIALKHQNLYEEFMNDKTVMQ